MKKCNCKTCTTPVEQQEFGKNSKSSDGLQPRCKECKRKADKAYRESDAGKISKKRNSSSDSEKTRRKEYYKRPEVVARQKEHKSSEEYKRKQREYAMTDERKEARRLFQETEKYKATRKRYEESLSFRESKKASEGRRRANKKKGSTGTVTQKYLQQLKENQGGKCYHCGKVLDFEDTKSVHLDHYIPLNKGGLHCVSNIVWSCAFCNMSKHDKVPEEPLTFNLRFHTS